MPLISQLTTWIALIDAAQGVPINKLNAMDQGAGQTVGEYITGFNLPTAGVDVVIALPAAVTLCVYIKNNGAGDVTVKWTPAGGAENTVILLKGANSKILFWEVVNGGGISTLKLNSSLNNTTVDFFLGA